MENKEIYIDGVDVSGCECYSEHREGYCGWHIPCEGDICPYKLKWALQQLKRKEQECEELKKIIDEAKNSKLDLKSFLVGEAVQNEYEQQLDQLKSENEDINEKLKEKFSEFMLKSSFIIAFQDNLLNKYKQALKEIKEITEEDCKQCFEIDGFSKPDDCGICPYNKILQKISEVEDGTTK